jgi:hypothetical protein
MRALVIGNGESRRNIDLFRFSKTHTTIGCNALHRDFVPDHLICCDNRMVREGLEAGVPKIYTRERYYRDHRKIAKNKNIFRLPNLPYEGSEKRDQPEHWGSGPYAVLLACELKFQNIDLLGFDLYGVNDKVNNVYKDTDNYAKSDSQPVDHSFWVYQIDKIFKNFSNRTFTVYNNRGWKIPREWTRDNIRFENISDIMSLTLNTEPV